MGRQIVLLEDADKKASDIMKFLIEMTTRQEILPCSVGGDYTIFLHRKSGTKYRLKTGLEDGRGEYGQTIKYDCCMLERLSKNFDWRRRKIFISEEDVEARLRIIYDESVKRGQLHIEGKWWTEEYDECYDDIKLEEQIRDELFEKICRFVRGESYNPSA